MKALIIIAACLALALVFATIEKIQGRRINSVGARSNNNSRHLAEKIDINNEEAMKEALENYKDLMD